MAKDRTIIGIGIDSGADNGKVPVYNSTTKVFDMSTAGAGTVTKSGTPVDNQVAIWTSATNLEGDPAFTFASSFLTLGLEGASAAIRGQSASSANTSGAALDTIGGAGNGSGDGGGMTVGGGNGGLTGGGGGVSITAGNGGGTSGNAGIVTITGGNSTTAGGGSILIRPGTGGLGSGNILFRKDSATSVGAVFDLASIASTSKTFTFPNVTGTFALLQATQTFTGINTFTPTARASGVASYLTINVPADTGITAATESKGINIVGATRTWADGTTTTQREYFFGKPTYNKTTTSATFTNLATLAIEGAPVAGAGVTLTHPWSLWVQAGNSHFGSQVGYTQAAVSGTGIEVNDTNNTTGGHVVTAQNTSSGTSAFCGFNMGNNQTVDGGATAHFAGIFFNSSAYTDTTFGTAFAIASQASFQNTDGPIAIQSASATGYVNFVLAGGAVANEVGRFTTAGLTVGLTGTLTGAIKFAGSTSTQITLQGQAVGNSAVLTLPSTTGTLASISFAQTFTGTQTFSQVNFTNNAIAASGNAATVPITSGLSTVTNNSAATLTITMTTTSAVDGQLISVRVLDSSAATQTITWVNTENSTISAPVVSNGSTTLPLEIRFRYNGATSKWRCIGFA